MTALLEIDRLVVRIGPIEAIRGLSLHVGEGEVVALLGANGAGKTTTLRTVSGLWRPASGDIRFRGRSICGLAPHRIVATGVAHAPEGHRLFPEMTVRENLLMGAYLFPAARSDATRLRRIFELFPVLGERQNVMANTLSGGERQMLALGRALMANPTLLLLDEPSLGLAPLLVERVGEMVAQLARGGGVTVLMAEQNASLALSVATRAYVLELGEVAHEGSSAELRRSPDVRRAYLGIA